LTHTVYAAEYSGQFRCLLQISLLVFGATVQCDRPM